jgi:hypothetical protein
MRKNTHLSDEPFYLCDLLDSRNFGPKPLLACEKLFLLLDLPLSRSLSFNIAHLVAAYP